MGTAIVELSHKTGVWAIPNFMAEAAGSFLKFSCINPLLAAKIIQKCSRPVLPALYFISCVVYVYEVG